MGTKTMRQVCLPTIKTKIFIGPKSGNNVKNIKLNDWPYRHLYRVISSYDINIPILPIVPKCILRYITVILWT